MLDQQYPLEGNRPFFSRQWWGSLKKIKPRPPCQRPHDSSPSRPPKPTAGDQAPAGRSWSGRARGGGLAEAHRPACACASALGGSPEGGGGVQSRDGGGPGCRRVRGESPTCTGGGAPEGSPAFPITPKAVTSPRAKGCFADALREMLPPRCEPSSPPPNPASCKEIEGGGGSQMSCK